MSSSLVRTLFFRSRIAYRSLDSLPTSTRNVTSVGRLKLPNTPHIGRRYRLYSSAANLQTGGRTIKLSYAFAAVTVFCSTTYLLGLFSPPAVFRLINPRPAPAPLAADSEEGKEYTERIEKELFNLELLKQCREKSDADEWYEARPYVQLPHERAVNSFTAGALRGPGKIAVPPLVRAKKDETEAWVFMHLGRGVCGHDGVVHGGLLATLLDEGCGRNAVLAFPSHVGVTANLNLDYKAPTMADQFVVMKTRLVELKGRKAIVHGQIEDLKGNVLVQAKALFIEPKFAGTLHSAGVTAIFPTTGNRIAHMTGARARVEGGGHVMDDGIVSGK